MTTDLQLSTEPGPRPRHRDAALFRVNRSADCRQWVWNRLRAAHPQAVTLADMASEAEGFTKSMVYMAARALTKYGFVERIDMEWAEIVKGKERIKRRISVRYSPEIIHGRRKW